MDYTQYYAEYPPGKTRRVLTATFRLTRAEMLDALKSDELVINGKIYETPERQLLGLIESKSQGLVELELIEIATPKK